MRNILLTTYRHYPVLFGVRTSVSLASVQNQNIKTFEIYRYNPETPEIKPYLQVFLYLISFNLFRNMILI